MILLGGYSWFANQYGLGVDNVISFDLVLPNGTFVTVSDTNHSELLFGLKGGSNNFGIVSGLTLHARPLGAVWVRQFVKLDAFFQPNIIVFQGGPITYAPSDAISQALSNFSLYNTDRKAQIVANYIHSGLDQVNPYILKLVTSLL